MSLKARNRVIAKGLAMFSLANLLICLVVFSTLLAPGTVTRADLVGKFRCDPVTYPCPICESPDFVWCYKDTLWTLGAFDKSKAYKNDCYEIMESCGDDITCTLPMVPTGGTVCGGVFRMCNPN